MRKDLSDLDVFIINRLQSIRNIAKVSAEELSIKIGKNPKYIQYAESGQYRIPFDILVKAIHYCKTTLEEFFSDNLEEYIEFKSFMKQYYKLSPETRAIIIHLMTKLQY
ncbi:MAG: helix-turn-helix transcriptional regulator [Clostridia bacterium]|nr:helix-turn-helix transcriptional regulator [Clostridia bacterium]